ncbi:SLY-1 homologous [Carabus blaptoides fortunei]
MVTLREKQINAIKQMLNLNQPQTKSVAAEPVWKILVYDRVGQDIISPILSVKELRELGVTLHVLLHSDRDPIPEVPAVYFCAPTEENLGRINQDFQNSVYDVYHLNFISPISRQKLEDIASAALQANCVANIHKVYDQYLNFISLEDDMFILRNQNSDNISYYAINRGDIKDTEMDTIMDSIVDSLFSVFVTLGNVPIIRCARGNAAEMVAKKLDKKLRDNLFDARNNLFQMDTSQAGNFHFQRPLLIVLDRNVDIATPLHHTWTYQALAHDTLQLSLNRLTVEERATDGVRAKNRICELDAKDKFWTSHKGSPFPTVAEAIQEELEQYRCSEEEVKKLKSSMGENDVALSMLSDNTARLTTAVNSLPQLLEKKRLIDMHTTIATGILNYIKTRKLDTFFEMEEKIMSKTALDKSILDILSEPDSGSAEDKMRLFIIYYICSPHISEMDYHKFESALSEAGCDMHAMAYIKRWRGFTKMSTASNQYEGAGTKTVSMFSKLVSQGSSFVMEGVKNLVVKKHNLPVTKIVDQLMEMKHSQDTEDYYYLDPKLLKVTETPRNRAPFQDAVVFVVGGGNYIEYQNLVDYAKHKTTSGYTKRIIYGSSTLNNAKQFLKQLSLLGKNCEAYNILSQETVCDALTHKDAEHYNIAKGPDMKMSSNGSTSGSDVSSTKNSKEKVEESAISTHGSPKLYVYNVHVQNSIYPPQFIQQLRTLKKNIRFYSMQKIEPYRYRCLLCRTDNMRNESQLMQHCVGRKHQQALSDGFAVSVVQNYHKIFSSLPMEFQAHQVVFVPYPKVPFVKCQVCHDRVQGNTLMDHVFSAGHIQRLSTRKFSQYCLRNDMLASLGCEVSEEDSSDMSSKTNKLLSAIVRPLGRQVPPVEDIVFAEEDTDDDLSEMSMKSQVIYNTAHSITSTCNGDTVQPDTVAQMADKQPVSNSTVPHASTKAEESKKPADSDKPAPKLEHNIVLAHNPHARDIFESLENRLQIHRMYLYTHNGGIECKLCDKKYKLHIDEIKKHLCTAQHMKAMKKDFAGKLKHTYFCEPCSKYVNLECNWQIHLLSVEHNQRKDMLAERNQSRFVEYECTACYHVMFGSKVTINKHLQEPVTKAKKRKKEIKLPQNVEKLLKSRVRLNEQVHKLCQESEKVLKAVELNWKCCEAIQTALEPEFGKCLAFPFGSRVSGLGTTKSDLDVFVDTGFMYSGMLYQDGESQARFVTRTAKTLRRHPDFTDLLSIPHARTPIVQVFHKPTGLDCDLSFRHGLSVENTEFIRLCINVQPSLKSLILILKKWSNMCKFHVKITTYALSMLAIFHFQISGYLPSLQRIRQLDTTETRIIADWKTFYYGKPITDLQQEVCPCDKTTKQLMCEFFGYYGKFPYDTQVVCPLLGRTVAKIDFHEDNASRLPPEMQVYVAKINESDQNEVFRSMAPMCIQDPFDLGHNLTKACPDSIVKKFEILCQMSHAVISSNEHG